MNVQDLMTAPVLSVDRSAPILEALRLMLEHRVSGITVVDKDGHLVGVVSEGDFLHRGELATEGARKSWWRELFTPASESAENYIRTHGRTVADVMSAPAVSIRPAASLLEAADLMSAHNVKRLPVVDDRGLVGIITRSDLLRALYEALPAGVSGVIDDHTIGDAVKAELARQPWSGNGRIRVDVRDGVVQLSGTIFEEAVRIAARVAAENVPGVKSVRTSLVLVEPMSGVVVDDAT